ncbi:MAG: hypothetical protein KJ970_19245 [Candidatus Eisenbacteria bacterium]|uniref:DUF4402 domain-containing protein n=1 Tax=Eiseniibacteriota bacterium TaxID=2212470 RepID=A0A948S1B6_UNCEI|nr:hypothetical protein [Candidatus Eisenbacteria bacterium]MBU1949721.1 hypothetical protein [Candidatus Eisenbacteria bacterium]MBU2693057.1 hypothetical protein [Candidatus Eisenbacteria bacterium]
MRRIIFIGMIALLSMTPVWAADDVDTQNSTVGGTIPELCQILIAGDLTGLLTLTQDGTGESAYDAGFIESAADATTLTLDANKQWKLSVKYNAEWTCPGAYDKDETDLTIKITNSPTGTIQNSYDSYQSPPVANEEMLSHATGVSDNSVEIQTRVDLDWTTDIPGVYSITLVYTMETY